MKGQLSIEETWQVIEDLCDQLKFSHPESLVALFALTTAIARTVHSIHGDEMFKRLSRISENFAGTLDEHIVEIRRTMEIET